jgi:polyhydroxyalkanoate synthesis regulator phasin
LDTALGILEQMEVLRSELAAERELVEALRERVRILEGR